MAMEERRHRLILDSALDAIVSMDANGRVLDWNKRAETLFGWTAGETIGVPLSQLIIPHQHRAAHERGLAHLLATGEGPILDRRIEITALRRDGTEFPVELTVAAGRIDDVWVFSSFIRDLTQTKVIENSRNLQARSAGILAEARTFKEAAGALLELFLERTPWEVCGFWTWDKRDRRLVLEEMRSRPEGDFAAFHAASEGLSPNAEEGLLCQVRSQGPPVWIHDLGAETDFIRKAAANACGLRTALAFPIDFHGMELGILECYSRRAFREEDGQAQSLVAVCQQLGQFLERKRAEDDLLRRDEQLKLIMDAAPALISYVDADRRYRFNNKAYMDWLGLSGADLIGKTLIEVLGPVVYETIRPKVDAVLAGESQAFEILLPFQRSGARFVQGHYLPHRREDGRIEGFVVFLVDISERRKMEEALLEKEIFLESIYNGAGEAIFVVDVGEDGTLTFSGFNPAYDRLGAGFGMDTKSLIGKPVRDLTRFLPEDAVAGVELRYTQCAASGAPLEYEEQAPINGKMTYWLTSLVPLPDASGRTFRIVGTAAEITRQKEDAKRIQTTEEQLRQSQKMEAVGRLAGGVAHDFNNLLTAINGLSELALLSMDDKAALTEMLTDIRKSGERAAALTGQLLAFSRKQILVPRFMDLNTAVAGMESLLRRVIGEDIDLVTVPGRDLKAVHIDPGQLEQVILNLAINARDAMPTGGRLTLETFSADVESMPAGAYLDAKPGPHVALSVTDTGIGMSPEVKERLFEPFFTTKDPGKGTGMGLATVYGIVKQSHGHIHVLSEPGKGTSFKIYFPAQERPPQGTDREPAAKGLMVRGRGESILVVEDEDQVRTYARKVLEGLGYRVRIAANGPEAIAIAADAVAPFRLLLTDVVMPGMSGLDLWDRLKVSQPGIQVLFMSGYADNAIVHHGVLVENTPFLHKPFSPSQLAEKVGMVLAAPKD